MRSPLTCHNGIDLLQHGPLPGPFVYMKFFFFFFLFLFLFPSLGLRFAFESQSTSLEQRASRHLFNYTAKTETHHIHTEVGTCSYASLARAPYARQGPFEVSVDHGLVWSSFQFPITYWPRANWNTERRAMGKGMTRWRSGGRYGRDLIHHFPFRHAPKLVARDSTAVRLLDATESANQSWIQYSTADSF